MREFSAHGLMVIDQIEIEGKQSRPTHLNQNIKNISKIVMKWGAVCICVTVQSDETLTRKLELQLGTTYKWQ